MARTVRTLVVHLYCCLAMMAAVLLRLAPGAAAAAAVPDGGPLLQSRRLASTGTATFAGGDVSSVRNKRWSTTFGANTNKNSTVNNAVQECTTDSDCLETPYTSCAVDMSDRKYRCLCADRKQPLNGDCTKKPRGPLFVPALRTSCESDVECLPNAVCKNNATQTNQRLKICMCKDGFTEEKESCNYAELLTFNYATVLITVFTSWIWNDRRV